MPFNSALLGAVRKNRGKLFRLSHIQLNRTHTIRNLLGSPVAGRDSPTAFIALRVAVFRVALSRELFRGLAGPVTVMPQPPRHCS